MINKPVALEQIKGLCSGIIYAEKFDEVELCRLDIGVSLYRNCRTGEFFHCRNERIGTIEEANANQTKDTTKEKIINHVSRKQDLGDKNQLNLFK